MVSEDRDQLKSFKFVGKEYLILREVVQELELYKDEIIKLAIKNKKRFWLILRYRGEYWIVDIDYGVIDKFEQFRDCCIQIDVGNAKRLGIKYDSDKYPVIHSAYSWWYRDISYAS